VFWAAGLILGHPLTLPSGETATLERELEPQLQKLQKDSFDVATSLRQPYMERQQALQAQLDKALAELRDVQAENRCLTGK
jgi:hypothetical protein